MGDHQYMLQCSEGEDIGKLNFVEGCQIQLDKWFDMIDPNFDRQMEPLVGAKFTLDVGNGHEKQQEEDQGEMHYCVHCQQDGTHITESVPL